jgi:hypothetical protein
VDLGRLCKAYYLPTMYSRGEYYTYGKNQKGSYDKLNYPEWDDWCN